MPDPVEHAQVEITQTGEHFCCNPQESLLNGMLRLGRRGIPSGCTQGGCGVCKVRIIEGRVRALGPISAAHVSAQEKAEGYTLACRVAPIGSVRLQICQKLSKSFCLNPVANNIQHETP